jgi:3-phosphoshikimate 1-carboxyvinyltransferase
MELTIKPVNSLRGELVIPGDKSISHRAVILTSLADGRSKIKGLLEAEDCLNTIKAFQAMGVKIDRIKPGEYLIDGVGLRGLKEPEVVIDCGNSGTGMRLLTGLLAAQGFYSVLSGDASLHSRPMDRVIEPLSRMGARIWARKNSYAPLSIMGSKLTGLEYILPVASAQVKSALLLAGLYAEGDVKLTEPGQSRDHTERMLQGFGVNLIKEDNMVILSGDRDNLLKAQEITVPGDISSAAFFLVAGLLTVNSEIRLKNIGINPTRSGILEVAKAMNARLELLEEKQVGGEPVADILVKSGNLRGTVIKGGIIPRIIDELPVIAVMASQAEGETVICDAAELRVKETDRIRAIVDQLKRLGVAIEELKDGMIINGPSRIKGGIRVKSYGDHRVAMALSIAGLLAEKEIIIEDSQSLNTSFPDFSLLLSRLTS